MLRFSALLLASVSIVAAQSKVGIINVQAAVLETAEIKKAQAELEVRFKPRSQQMEKLQKELADLQAQVQAGAGKLTPQAEQNLQITGQRKQRELQRVGEDLQADVDRERNDILQKTGARMQEVVRKLAEQKGLDVVMDVTTTVYYKAALEITKEAVVAFDAAYPVAAAAPATK